MDKIIDTEKLCKKVDEKLEQYPFTVSNLGYNGRKCYFTASKTDDRHYTFIFHQMRTINEGSIVINATKNSFGWFPEKILAINKVADIIGAFLGE